MDIFYQYRCEETALLNKYVGDHLDVSKYDTIMAKLRELGAYGYDNAYWYGDVDVYGYIETVDEQECLIIDNVVSCYDRPLVVISVNKNIFHDPEIVESTTRNRLRTSTLDFPMYDVVAVCTERTSTIEQPPQWNDRRDYRVVGLDLIKEKGFKFLYGDARDDEWAFNTPRFVRDGRLHYENLKRDNTLFVLSEFSYFYDNLGNLSK